MYSDVIDSDSSVCYNCYTSSFFFLAAIKSVGDNLWVQPTNTLGFGKSNVSEVQASVQQSYISVYWNKICLLVCGSPSFKYVYR